MRNTAISLLLAIFLQCHVCQAANVSPPGATPAAGKEAAMNSSLGELRQVFDLKDVIKDIPENLIAGIAFDRNRNLYVATYGRGAVQAWTNARKPLYRIDHEGKASLFADVECGLLGIIGIDGENRLYLSTSNNREDATTDIIKVMDDGSRSTFASGFKQPCSGVFDSQGKMYVVDALQNRIYALTPQGDKSVFLDINSSSLASGLLFHGMAFDRAWSTCYLVGYSPQTGRVLKCRIGKDGHPGPLLNVCTLPAPNFISMDALGNAYVTFAEKRLARILAGGSQQLSTDAAISYYKTLSDFDGRMYIVTRECRLFEVVGSAR